MIFYSIRPAGTEATPAGIYDIENAAAVASRDQGVATQEILPDDIEPAVRSGGMNVICTDPEPGCSRPHSILLSNLPSPL